MNEGILSAQVVETAPQVSVSARLNSYNAEVLAQMATDSSLQLSSFVLEALQPVSRTAIYLLTVFK